jgi:hypothetical protein
LEKRIRKIEESLQNPALANNNATTAAPVAVTPTTSLTHHLPAPSRQDSMQSTTTTMGAPTTATNKRPQGASSDPIQYLGDMSSFQFFSNKIHLDDKNTKWKGQYIRRFGKQVVLIEDGKEEQEEKQAEIPQNQLLPYVQPIHYWIYSVTGADRHTSDRLLKM